MSSRLPAAHCWTHVRVCAKKEHMHEMSIADSILSIVKEELQKHQLHTLLLVRVRYGAMSSVVPESLRFCFEAMTTGTPLEGARMELEEIPVILRCCACGTEFAPEDGQLLGAVCPSCGQPLGHAVVQGRELYIQHIEAE